MARIFSRQAKLREDIGVTGSKSNGCHDDGRRWSLGAPRMNRDEEQLVVCVGVSKRVYIQEDAHSLDFLREEEKKLWLKHSASFN